MTRQSNEIIRCPDFGLALYVWDMQNYLTEEQKSDTRILISMHMLKLLVKDLKYF